METETKESKVLVHRQKTRIRLIFAASLRLGVLETETETGLFREGIFCW